MLPVVSSEQMRKCDETTISKIGIPGLVLMDRAGTAAAHVILNSYPPSPGSRAVIICGKGNNGGDGFVCARVLAENGYAVDVALTAPATALKGDSRTSFSILRKVSRLRGSQIRMGSFGSVLRKRLANVSVVVDAVFGTGFKGAAQGVQKKAIAWMNASGAPVVALDVPSGIDATTGTVTGAHVVADLTVTFGLVKTGLLLNRGSEVAGHVSAVDIGIPSDVVRRTGHEALLVEQPDVRALLPGRPRRLHKYAAGKVLVVAGSKGYTGAPNLASHAALRSGAGAVVLMVPDAIYPILAKKRTDEIVVPVEGTPEGTIGPASVGAVVEKLAWADVLLIGPGLALSDNTRACVEEVLRRARIPVVIDADALTIVAGSRTLRGLLRSRNWILTPHTGEFDRFVRKGASAIENARIRSARDFVRSTRATLVLKGAPTVVADRLGEVFINPTGNPGMATVGSGDVLAGCIAALRAQGLGPSEAAWAGAYLHGRAGDLARDVLGERSLVASDLLQYLPVALRESAQ